MRHRLCLKPHARIRYNELSQYLDFQHGPESDGSCGDRTFSDDDFLGVGSSFEEPLLDADSGVLFRDRFLFFLKLWKNFFCSEVNIL